MNRRLLTLHINNPRDFRSGEPTPLLCLSQHPGQSHLLAVGGVASNYGSGDQSTATTTSYIWDLREERHPLSEIACRGGTVWEISFHSHQPQYLFLATEEAGLMRIHSPASTASTSYPSILGIATYLQ